MTPADELCGVQFKVPDSLRAGVRVEVCNRPVGHYPEGHAYAWPQPDQLPRRVPRAALDPEEYLDPEVTKLVREVLDADPTELVLAAAQRVVAERDELRRDRDATRAEWADLHAVAADAIAERDRLRSGAERPTGYKVIAYRYTDPRDGTTMTLRPAEVDVVIMTNDEGDTS